MIKRGFFTIATGNEKYYKFASNLLKSYRLHNSNYPFGILCARENEYTEIFDQVVILDNVNNNYLDKFRMLIDSPYQEGIFIEPDCLIYKDISCFFDMLAKESDFSSFGWNDDKLSHWFDDSRTIIEKYGSIIQEIPLFCPGYIFVRKTNKCRKMYNDLLELSDWIMNNTIDDNPKLIGGSGLRDDPIFCIAMKLNGFVCAEKPSVGKCINYPRVKRVLRINIRKGVLDVVQEREYYNCNLLHFSTRRCVEEGLYWHQCVVLKLINKKVSNFIIGLMESRFFIECFQVLRKIKYAIVHRVK